MHWASRRASDHAAACQRRRGIRIHWASAPGFAIAGAGWVVRVDGSDKFATLWKVCSNDFCRRNYLEQHRAAHASGIADCDDLSDQHDVACSDVLSHSLDELEDIRLARRRPIASTACAECSAGARGAQFSIDKRQFHGPFATANLEIDSRQQFHCRTAAKCCPHDHDQLGSVEFAIESLRRVYSCGAS
jgi:hypothetical protein